MLYNVYGGAIMNKLNTLKKKLDFLLEDELSSKEKCEEILHISQEVVEYLKKEISKEEMVEKIKQESRRYAKRQLTWFRKEKNNIWIDGTDEKQKNIDLILKELNNSGEEIK